MLVVPEHADPARPLLDMQEAFSAFGLARISI